MKSLDNASNRTCGVNNSTLGPTVATVTAPISNIRALLLLTLRNILMLKTVAWCPYLLSGSDEKICVVWVRSPVTPVCLAKL